MTVIASHISQGSETVKREMRVQGAGKGAVSILEHEEGFFPSVYEINMIKEGFSKYRGDQFGT